VLTQQINGVSADGSIDRIVNMMAFIQEIAHSSLYANNSFGLVCLTQKQIINHGFTATYHG